MSAPELLRRLRSDGLQLKVLPDGGLHVAPRDALTDDHRAAIRAKRDALVIALRAESASPPAQRSRGGEPAVQPRPFRPTREQADAAHAEPWDDQVVARFSGRVVMLMRRGLHATDADDMAERLHLRDVQADGRAMCLECAHVRSTGPWRCANFHEAGLQSDGLGRDLATTLQRCGGFASLDSG